MDRSTTGNIKYGKLPIFFICLWVLRAIYVEIDGHRKKLSTLHIRYFLSKTIRWNSSIYKSIIIRFGSYKDFL